MIAEEDTLESCSPEESAALHVEVSSKQRRGFAAMSPEMRQKISSMGGKAAHAKGTGHEFTSEEARRAGARGGAALRKKRDAEKTP